MRPFAPVRAGPPTAVPRADPVRRGAALDPGPAIASGKQPLDPGLAQLEDAGGRGRRHRRRLQGRCDPRTRPGARPRRCASSTRVPWARPSQCRSTRAGSRRRVRCHCHQARTRRRRDAKQPLMSSCTPQGAARSAPSWSHSRRYWRVVCQPRPRLCRRGARTAFLAAAAGPVDGGPHPQDQALDLARTQMGQMPLDLLAQGMECRRKKRGTGVCLMFGDTNRLPANHAFSLPRPVFQDRIRFTYPCQPPDLSPCHAGCIAKPGNAVRKWLKTVQTIDRSVIP